MTNRKTAGSRVNAFWERNRKSEGYLLKKTIYDLSFRVIRFFLLFGMCFMILQPILSKWVTSWQRSSWITERRC